jgi:hypothetical protein
MMMLSIVRKLVRCMFTLLHKFSMVRSTIQHNESFPWYFVEYIRFPIR